MTTRSRYGRSYRANRATLLANATRCTWCGCEISTALPKTHPQKATADHIIPVVHGGSHSLENLVPACFDCNCKRRANGPDWRPGVDVAGADDW